MPLALASCETALAAAAAAADCSWALDRILTRRAARGVRRLDLSTERHLLQLVMMLRSAALLASALATVTASDFADGAPRYYPKFGGSRDVQVQLTPQLLAAGGSHARF